MTLSPGAADSMAQASVCEVCAEIPFELLFSKGNRLNVLNSFVIGTLTEIQSRQHCLLCRICNDVFSSIKDGLEYSHDLHIRPKAVISANRYNNTNDDLDWYYMSISMQLFIGPHAHLELVRLQDESFGPYPQIERSLIIQKRCDIDSGPLSPANSQTQTFLSDAQLQSLAKAALRCKDFHTSCNVVPRTSSQPSTEPSLYLVDVRDRSISRHAQFDTQYIKLSYRWPDTSPEVSKRPRDFQTTDDSGVHIEILPPNLPSMIEDVIQVIQRLGQRYLWIDKYCINQNDPVEVHQTVLRMDDIYENSLLTICPFWTDAGGKLPGVTVPFKTHSLQVANTDISVFASERIMDFNDEFVNTPWHQRGWIFQESLLSRQRLIFSPSAVTLLCPEQGVSTLFRLERQTRMGIVGSDLQLRENLGVTTWSFDLYQQIVQYYIPRELTFQRDVLDAISGILTRITRQTGMAFQQALPTERLQFLNALLWSQNPYWTDHQQLMHEVNLRKRCEFASWSWLGFNIPAYYPLWLKQRQNIVHPPDSFDLMIRSETSPSVWSNTWTAVFNISLLAVAEYKHQNAILKISTQCAHFPCAFSQVSKKWTLCLKGTNHSFLTSRSRLAGFLIDSQVFSRLSVIDGTLDLELLMLAHISASESSESWNNDGVPEVGDTVLAIVVVRTDGMDVVERVAIVAVPYSSWQLAQPKHVKLDII